MYFKPDEVLTISQKILNGNVGIFPFDTLLGLTGCISESTVKRLEFLKKRTHTPFILVLPELSYISEWVEPLSQWQKDIIHKYWPGPITFIFKKHKSVKDSLTAGRDTIAIRIPSFLPLNFLLDNLKQGVLSTSVNLHGQPSIHVASECDPYILSHCDFTVSNFSSRFEECSTIVDLSNSSPRILRKGVVDFHVT